MLTHSQTAATSTINNNYGKAINVGVNVYGDQHNTANFGN